jgi:UPF0755 protein
VSDDLGLFSDDAGDSPRRSRKQTRQRRERFRRRRRRRTVTALAGLCVLLVVGVGVLYGASQLLNIGTYDDFEGAGDGQVVVQVKPGDTTSDIARTLAEQGVVASSKAFTKAAEQRKAVIQPGFYLMKSRMSGAAAVELILSPDAKVGRVEVRGGDRLEDQTQPDGKVVDGILTRLAKGGCAGPPGKSPCATPEQMHRVAAQADLASLGVPDWAIGPASATEPKRRLEGLIMPGVYDVKPGESPEELLRSVVKDSAFQLQAAGLPQAAAGTGSSPYQLLTMASLAQSEAIRSDFGRVTRVINNRLRIKMPLQFDSTVNYPLDKPTLLTKPEDRERPGPYNTYDHPGLPVGPISAVSKDAIVAAEKPIDGRWIYFVKCDPNGTSCFAETPQEHEANKRVAQQRGAF